MIIDILLVVVLVAGFYVGESLSIFRLLFNLILMIICLTFAIELAPSFNQFVVTNFGESLNHTYIFSLIFGLLISLIFVFLIRRFLKNVIDFQFLKKVDNYLSGIFMSLIFGVLLSGLIWFFHKADFISDKIKANSYSFETLIVMPSKVEGVRENIKKGYNIIKEKSNDSIKRVKESHDGSDQ